MGASPRRRTLSQSLLRARTASLASTATSRASQVPRAALPRWPARGAAALVPNPPVCCEFSHLFPRAEPVAAFRVCAGGSLKTKIEEWKVPYSYTSDPRNLLQCHFRKVTAGSWFEGGAVIVLTPVAESVERTWGLEQKQPHPKWGGVVWHA